MTGRRRLGARSRWLAALVLIASMAASCGTSGAERFEGESPDPVAVYGQCAFCHDGVAQRMVDTGGHHDLGVKCETCHAERTEGTVGPQHRAIPACRDCHQTQATHPAGETGTNEDCVSCHAGHGSSNLYLIAEEIPVGGGAVRPVTLVDASGLADGGFASVSDPGSGLCEVCHTTTRYYRSDGSGDDHFEFTCFACHVHSTGFEAESDTVLGLALRASSSDRMEGNEQ